MKKPRVLALVERCGEGWRTTVYWERRQLGTYDGSLTYCESAARMVSNGRFRSPGALLSAMISHGSCDGSRLLNERQT